MRILMLGETGFVAEDFSTYLTGKWTFSAPNFLRIEVTFKWKLPTLTKLLSSVKIFRNEDFVLAEGIFPISYI